MARNGRPPVPTERKRALGNPGKRSLPKTAAVVSLDAAVEIPDPPRPLGPGGTQLWTRAWLAARSWLSPQTDVETLLMVCEPVDERIALRITVLRDGVAEDRKALRDLDKQVLNGLSILGFTPTDRARLGLAEVKAISTLERLKQQRG
jgi:hypothetical protein